MKVKILTGIIFSLFISKEFIATAAPGSPSPQQTAASELAPFQAEVKATASASSTYFPSHPTPADINEMARELVEMNSAQFEKAMQDFKALSAEEQNSYLSANDGLIAQTIANVISDPNLSTAELFSRLKAVTGIPSLKTVEDTLHADEIEPGSVAERIQKTIDARAIAQLNELKSIYDKLQFNDASGGLGDESENAKTLQAEFNDKARAYKDLLANMSTIESKFGIELNDGVEAALGPAADEPIDRRPAWFKKIFLDGKATKQTKKETLASIATAAQTEDAAIELNIPVNDTDMSSSRTTFMAAEEIDLINSVVNDIKGALSTVNPKRVGAININSIWNADGSLSADSPQLNQLLEDWVALNNNFKNVPAIVDAALPKYEALQQELKTKLASLSKNSSEYKDLQNRYKAIESTTMELERVKERVDGFQTETELQEEPIYNYIKAIATIIGENKSDTSAVTKEAVDTEFMTSYVDVWFTHMAGFDPAKATTDNIEQHMKYMSDMANTMEMMLDMKMEFPKNSADSILANYGKVITNAIDITSEAQQKLASMNEASDPQAYKELQSTVRSFESKVSSFGNIDAQIVSGYGEAFQDGSATLSQQEMYRSAVSRLLEIKMSDVDMSSSTFNLVNKRINKALNSEATLEYLSSKVKVSAAELTNMLNIQDLMDTVKGLEAKMKSTDPLASPKTADAYLKAIGDIASAMTTMEKIDVPIGESFNSELSALTEQGILTLGDYAKNYLNENNKNTAYEPAQMAVGDVESLIMGIRAINNDPDIQLTPAEEDIIQGRLDIERNRQSILAPLDAVTLEPVAADGKYIWEKVAQQNYNNLLNEYKKVRATLDVQSSISPDLEKTLGSTVSDLATFGKQLEALKTPTATKVSGMTTAFKRLLSRITKDESGMRHGMDSRATFSAISDRLSTSANKLQDVVSDENAIAKIKQEQQQAKLDAASASKLSEDGITVPKDEATAYNDLLDNVNDSLNAISKVITQMESKLYSTTADLADLQDATNQLSHLETTADKLKNYKSLLLGHKINLDALIESEDNVARATEALATDAGASSAATQLADVGSATEEDVTTSEGAAIEDATANESSGKQLQQAEQGLKVMSGLGSSSADDLARALDANIIITLQQAIDDLSSIKSGVFGKDITDIDSAEATLQHLQADVNAGGSEKLVSSLESLDTGEVKTAIDAIGSAKGLSADATTNIKTLQTNLSDIITTINDPNETNSNLAEHILNIPPSIEPIDVGIDPAVGEEGKNPKNIPSN